MYMLALTCVSMLVHMPTHSFGLLSACLLVRMRDQVGLPCCPSPSYCCPEPPQVLAPLSAGGQLSPGSVLGEGSPTILLQGGLAHS